MNMSITNLSFFVFYLLKIKNLPLTFFEKRSVWKKNYITIETVLIIVQIVILILEILLYMQQQNVIPQNLWQLNKLQLFNSQHKNKDMFYKLEYFSIFIISILTNFLQIYDKIGSICIKKNNKNTYIRNVFICNFLEIVLILNLVLCLCYNNGLKSLPLIIFFGIFLLIKTIPKSHSSKHRYKIFATFIFGWYMLFLQIFTYVCNIQDYRDYFLDNEFLNLFGKGVIQDKYDKIKEVLNTIFFINLFFYSTLLQQIIKLQNSQSFEYYLSQKRILLKRNRRNFYVFKLLLKKLHEHSTKLAQISLVVWGLTKISWIKFTFLLLGLIGLLESKNFFQKYLFKITLYLSAIYLFLQTTYNQSYVDVFLKSFGSKMDEHMFKIGFYKYYNLFHGHLLKFKYTYDEIKIKRKQGMLQDTIIFAIFFLLYRFSLKKPSSSKSILRFNSSIAQNAVSFFEELKNIVIDLTNKNTMKFVALILLYVSQLRLSLMHFKYLLFFFCYLVFSKKSHQIKFTKIFVYIIALEIVTVYFYTITDIKISQNAAEIIGLQLYDSNLLYFYKEHLLVLVVLILTKKIRQSNDNLVPQNINDQQRNIYQCTEIIKQNSIAIICILNLVIFINSDANMFLIFQFLLLLIFSFIKVKQSIKNAQSQKKLLQKLTMFWICYNCIFVVCFYLLNMGIIQSVSYWGIYKYFQSYSLGLLNQKLYQKIQIFYIGIHIYFLYYYYVTLRQKQQDLKDSIYLKIHKDIIKISNFYNPNRWQYKISYFCKILMFLFCQNFALIVNILIFICCYYVSSIINLILLALTIFVFQINSNYTQQFCLAFAFFVIVTYQISHIVNFDNIPTLIQNQTINSFFVIIKNQDNIIQYYSLFCLCIVKFDMEKRIIQFKDEFEYSDFLYERYFHIKNFEKNAEIFLNYIKQKNNTIGFKNIPLKNFFIEHQELFIQYIQDRIFISFNKYKFEFQLFATHVFVPFLSFLVLLFVFQVSNFLNVVILILVIFIAKNFTWKQKNNKMQIMLCRLNFALFYIIFILIVFEQQLNQSQIFENFKMYISSKFCDQQLKEYVSQLQPFQNLNDYDYCEITWQAYFLFQNRQSQVLVFIILMINICTIHHSKNLHIDQQKADKRISIYFKLDHKKQRSYFIFDHLPPIILMSFFVLNSFLVIIYQQDSFLSLLYTVPGLLVSIKGCFYKRTQRIKLLRIFENLNFFFMTLFMIYQTPIFKCPFQLQNRKFIGSNECSYILQDVKDNFYNNQFTSINQQIYYFIYINLGFTKLDQQGQFANFIHQTMIVLFFIITILKQIWNYQENTKTYFIKIQENRKKLLLAIKYILNYFITRFWTYDKHQQQKDIFKLRNQEIDERIEQWEDAMNIKSGHNSILIQDDEEINQLIKKKKKFANNQKSLKQTQAENLINSFSTDEPILKIEEIYSLYNQYNDKTIINQQIKQMQQQKCIIISEQILNLRDLQITQIFDKEFLQSLNLWNYDKNEPLYQEIIQEQIENIPNRNKKKIEKLEGQANLKEKNFKQKFYKFCYKIRENIKQKFIQNTSIYLQLSKDKKREFLLIFRQFIQDKFEVLILVSLFFNLIFNGDVVSFIPLFLIMIIGITSSPFVSHNFWKFFLYYFFVLILIKLVYQLPIFCKTTPYVFSFSRQCENLDSNRYFLSQRIDYIIGIKKFYTHSNAQKDILYISNFVFDYICLLIIFIHVKVQKNVGITDFIKTNNDYRQIPILDIEKVQKKFPNLTLDKDYKAEKSHSSASELNTENNSNDSSSNSISNSSIMSQEFGLQSDLQPSQNEFVKQLKNSFYKFVPVQHQLKQNIKVSDTQNIFEKLQFEPLFLKSGRNFYSILFCIEILVFLSIVFFYDTLLGSQNSFASDLQKSQFSEDLVYIILKIIFVILVNRICFCKRYSVFDHNFNLINENEVATPKAFYLLPNKKYEQQPFLSKHNMSIKYFLYFIMILMTFYFFFYTVPQSNKNTFIENQGAKYIFTIVFIYLNLTGLQIKYGYSNNSIGSPYAHKISPGENFSRKVFMSLPFLFEIKTVLDWTITKTSLDLYQWFKLEDAYTTLRITKYQMQVRKFNKLPIDFRKKVAFGFCFLLFLLGLIIFPMLLFSTLNPNYVVNEPQRAQFSIKIWTQYADEILEFPLIESQHIQIQNIEESEYKRNLDHIIKLNKHESLSQIKKFVIEKYVDHLWNLSPPKIKQIQDLIEKQQRFYLTIVWNIYHEQNEKITSSQLHNTIIVQQKNLKVLSEILVQQKSYSYLQFEDLIPEVIYLNSAQSLSLQEKNQIVYKTVKDIHMKLDKEDNQNFWELNNADFDQISFYVHCDYVLGNMLGNTLKDMSVVGFYVTVVLAIGQIIKSIFKNITMRVIYEEMPQTNQLIEFCESIYVARKEEDLLREKKLYDILIRIYRSPELLIQLTGNYSKQYYFYTQFQLIKIC